MSHILSHRIDVLEDTIRDLIEAFDIPPAIKDTPEAMRHGEWRKKIAAVERARLVLGAPEARRISLNAAMNSMHDDRRDDQLRYAD